MPHDLKPFPIPPSGPCVVDGELLRRLFDAVSWNSRLQVQPPLRLGDGGAGPMLSLAVSSAAAIPAEIIAAGPLGEADSLLPHQHYWAQKKKVTGTTTVTISGHDYLVPAWGNDGDPVLASNRNEILATSHLIGIGAQVELVVEAGPSYWFDRVKAVAYPVILTRDGPGSGYTQGDRTHTINATYTPTLPNGDPIYTPGTTTQITGLSPVFARYQNVKCSVATYGWFSFSGTTPTLWDTDERPIFGACS